MMVKKNRCPTCEIFNWTKYFMSTWLQNNTFNTKDVALPWIQSQETCQGVLGVSSLLLKLAAYHRRQVKYAFFKCL